jgi:cytidine deaminase
MNPWELIHRAVSAAQAAYAPYSRYRVGAALLAEDGRVFTGCNVENASYGLTMCAERTAIFKAVSEGCTTFSAIAIAAGDSAHPPYPCGACRQVIAQFCQGSMPIHVAPLDNPGAARRFTLDELLPHRFDL